MKYIKSFLDLNKNNADTAGGKGASLGEMTQTGLAIPEGYVILSNAFEYFLQETDLNIEIEAIFKTVNHNDIHTVEHASEKIQGLILNSLLPKDLEEEIKVEFGKLNSEYIAVRSSATSEDGAEHAWAGQLDTFLNTTKENLLENVKRCFASLFTPRAIFYRFEKGLHDTHISVAVVVQKMIQSEISGIAFSVHPVTEDRDQLIIEAGYGLGEAIVSGSITPDSYVVSKSKKEILDKNIVRQERGLFKNKIELEKESIKEEEEEEKEINQWQEIEENKKDRQKLTDEQILELSNIIINIENHYGFACDIEWAYENNKFYITQSRPITTLRSNSVLESDVFKGHKKDTSDKTLYTSEPYQKFLEHKGSAEALLIRGKFSPLFVATWILEDGKMGLYSIFKNDQALSAIRLDMYTDSGARTLRNYLQGTFDLDQFKKKYEVYKNRIDSLYLSKIDVDLRPCKESEIIETVYEVIDILDTIITESLFIEFLESKTVYDVLKSLNLEVGAVESILKYISETPFNSFIKRFKNAKITFVGTSISESVINKSKYLYTDYFSTKDHSYIENDLKIYLDENLEGVDYNDALFTSKLNPQDLHIFEYIKYVTHLRDYRKDDIAKCNALLLILSEDLASRSGIKKELAPYLLSTELIKGVDWIVSNRKNIESRINGFEVFRKGKDTIIINNNPNIILDIIEKQLSPHRGNVDFIYGESASLGKITGTVRIVLDPNGKGPLFNRGDVLVTSMTRPDFIHLMKNASGIVTNEGGITCHAAIVSRELKIPCVIGTKIATQVLHDGDLVEVDADNGVVRIIEKSSNKKTLVNIFSREKSLLYFCMWDDSDRKSVELLGEQVKNNLFIVPVYSKGSVWYEKEELNLLKEKFVFALSYNEDNVFWTTIKDLIHSSWTYIKPYAKKEKELKSADEFNEYYQHLVDFWTCLSSFIYEVLDDPRINFAIRQELTNFRNETENYTEKMSEILMDFLYKNIPNRDIANFLTKSEIVDILGKKLDYNNLIVQRKQGLFMLNGNVHNLNILESTLSMQNLTKEVILSNGIDVTGNSAFPGSVRGVVAIVKTFKDIEKVKDNNVLVTEMTNPKYLVAFKKSIAVVTDQGGTLCHAAITARELKIPCIIGTKIATQVLHDGDLVEVDADNGVVRVIERATDGGSKHNNDLLHGITLEKVIETLVQRIGWQKMGESVNIKCFTDNPNVRSSLHFLRRMPWAREKVEQLYIETLTIEGKIK